MKFDASQDNDLNMDEPDFSADPLEIPIALEAESEELRYEPDLTIMRVEFTTTRKRKIADGHR
jgi:hypothetical protein